MKNRHKLARPVAATMRAPAAPSLRHRQRRSVARRPRPIKHRVYRRVRILRSSPSNHNIPVPISSRNNRKIRGTTAPPLAIAITPATQPPRLIYARIDGNIPAAVVIPPTSVRQARRYAATSRSVQMAQHALHSFDISGGWSNPARPVAAHLIRRDAPALHKARQRQAATRTGYT